MRILYVSHTHPPEGAILENAGGMQRVSSQLVRELSQKKSVELITDTINVSGKGRIGVGTFLFLIRQLVRLPVHARETKADVILFSSMVTASLALLLRKRISIPMVTINHGRDVTLPVKIYQQFVPKIFDSLDGVISVSRATRKECIKRGMPPYKGIALPNGFDSAKPENIPGKQRARSGLEQAFGIPLGSRFMLLTVGRQVKRKGHEWFIRNVLPEIKPEVTYVVIGDGPESGRISKAARESEKSDSIFLLGRQPDSILKQAYAAADLFVMPNIPVAGDMEGFGVVMLEANMAQTPAVASGLEGIKDVICPGRNGYLAPPLKAGQFAKQVNNVLRDGLADLSKKARIYVQEQFSWEKVADRYIVYLQKVIDG